MEKPTKEQVLLDLSTFDIKNLTPEQVCEIIKEAKEYILENKLN